MDKHSKEQDKRLGEWDKRLDAKKAIIDKLRTLNEILSNHPEQEQVIRDLDAFIERYSGIIK
jgi:uncharacterized protein with von Willebrand factor type A (vWA) domain